MIKKNQDETRDTGESGETYDQEMEVNRVLPIKAENARLRPIQLTHLGKT